MNIDATPGLMNIFRFARSKDINVQAAISNSKRKMNYLIFDFPAYNGFEKTFETARIPYIHLKQKIEISPVSLHKILDTYISKNQVISVLFVDTEGHDLEVLKSNKWSTYQPKYIVCESFTASLQEVLSSKTYKYLHPKGYEAIASTRTNVLFKNTRVKSN